MGLIGSVEILAVAEVLSGVIWDALQSYWQAPVTIESLQGWSGTSGIDLYIYIYI